MVAILDVKSIQAEFEAIFKPSPNYEDFTTARLEEKITECRRFIANVFGTQVKQTKLLFGEIEGGNQVYFGELHSWSNGVMLFDPSLEFTTFFSLLNLQRPNGTILENLHNPRTVISARSLAFPDQHLDIVFDLRVASAQELGPKYGLKFGSATIVLSGTHASTYSIPNEHAQMLDRWFETNL